MSGARFLRAVPDPRDGAVLDWIGEHEPVDAGPVLDAVFETLGDIRQVRPWPWDAAVEALRPVDRDTRVRRWAVVIAAALITALVVGATMSGGIFVRPLPTVVPSATTSQPSTSALVSPSLPAAVVYPLASPRLVIVSGGQDGSLYLDWTDGTARVRLGPELAMGSGQPAWAPDGSRILVLDSRAGTEQQWEIDPTGVVPGQVVLPCVAPCGSRNEASYSPDGTKIVFFEARGEVVHGIPTDCAILLYDRAAQTTQPIHEFACGTEEDREPRISPDGRSVAFWRSRHDLPDPSLKVLESAIFIRDLGTGEERQVTEWDVHATSLDWSPDGQWIAFTKEWWRYAEIAYETDVWRIRPDGTSLRQLTELDGDVAWQPRYSPDGQWIIFARVDGRETRLWAVPANGGDAVEVLPGGGQIYQFDVLPAELLGELPQPSATPSPSST
jgi:sugar lactone lactonase YvrE